MLMLKRYGKRFLSVITVCSVFITSISSHAEMITDENNEIYTSDSSLSEINEMSVRLGNYQSYLDKYPSAVIRNEIIQIEAENYTNASSEPSVLNDYEGMAGASVLTEEDGFIEYTVNVENEGLYCLKLDFYTYKGKGNDIERKLSINGEVPFDNASYFTFHRIWKNKSEVTQDVRGNDKRPSQIEENTWQTEYFKDYLGFVSEPYLFYFNKGENTIRLTSSREPLVIRKISLTGYKNPISYNEYASVTSATQYSGETIKIQGEEAVYKSAPTIYALNDRTSPATEPSHHYLVKLNTIGGDRWKMPGQKITWEFEAPESALYQIHVKYRQNLANGRFSVRKFEIDGETPFVELENVKYGYENKWKMGTLQDANGEPYWIYLEKGTHSISMEIVLGEMAEILNTASQSLSELNKAYRRLMMLIGSTPDTYRDYNLKKQAPDALQTLQEQAEILKRIESEIVAINGQRGESTSILTKLYSLLERMAVEPDYIPKSWALFRDSISSLGTWILLTQETPLEIDYILVSGDTDNKNNKLPNTGAGFFESIAYQFMSLISSYMQDYTSVGDVYSETEAISVWMQSGRDQANILKQMTDDKFITEANIPVNLRLVKSEMILPAAVAGNGPDVLLGMAIGDPVNYALRGAAADLSGFGDVDEVLTNFYSSASESYSFDGKLYGLPETQTFFMMFVREDILSEFGLAVPKTWEEFYIVMTEVQKSYMEVAIPQDDHANITFFMSLASQKGSDIYTEGGVRCNLDTGESVEAFKLWTLFFTDYGSPLIYDFANRFRSGEMPIGFADYTMFNTLSVFAPEIKGLWQFYPLPGFEDENGNLDNTVVTTGTACMILETSENKNHAWEFMKWWVSTDTQTTYGREMESLLGSAARYATANYHAVENLSWTVKDYKNLLGQWNNTIGLPQVPGSYYTPWHIINAFRSVVYNEDDPQETLVNFVEIINNEIQIKREEFGLYT